MGRIVTISDNKIQSRGVAKARQGERIDQRYKDSVSEWLAGGKWIGVKSSNVKQIRYEKAAQKMWVKFKAKGGQSVRTYYYPSVTSAIARKFYQAASMGKFVWWMRRHGYVGIEV